MTADQGGDDRADARWLVLGVVLVVLVLTGPVVGLDVTEPSPAMGDGNATVAVLQAPTDSIPVTQGRFGTDVPYLRLPAAAVDVRNLRGQPRVVYRVVIPELGVDRRVSRVVTSEGTVRLSLPDRALSPAVAPGTYTGLVDLRIQSFEGQTVLVNRSVEVTVP